MNEIDYKHIKAKDYIKSSLVVIAVILIDQIIKYYMLSDDLSFSSKCLSSYITINKGVAFSMFAFLGDSLKYIQIVLICGIIIYIFFLDKKAFIQYTFAISLILGGGISNIYDRFLHGGVIDYISWHCYFNFAIFNLADVFINIGVGLIILQIIFSKKAKFSVK